MGFACKSQTLTQDEVPLHRHGRNVTGTRKELTFLVSKNVCTVCRYVCLVSENEASHWLFRGLTNVPPLLLALLHSTSPELKINTKRTRRVERTVVYLRDPDLKDVVLDQLLPQHDDAELNAQLNEAASWRTLRETRALHLYTYSSPLNVLLIQPGEKKERYKAG